MARYKNGINGQLSGKVGSVIASSWRGVDYLKGLNNSSGKRRTAGQLRQQEVFALVTRWLKPVRDVVWIGFQSVREAKTPMNEAISLVMRHAVVFVDGKPLIDFPKVVFSRGVLLASWVTGVFALPGAGLRVEWLNASGSVCCNGDDDRACFLFYNLPKGCFAVFMEDALRADGSAVLQLPADFAGDAVQGYMFYTCAAGKRVSTSVYLGCMVLV